MSVNNKAQTPNPRYPGAPARMADGRLFTEYRSSCSLLAPLKDTTFADFERNQLMKTTGVYQISNDRMMSTMKAGSSNCVDTMVPELKKRVYAWDGPVAAVNDVMTQPIGIGTGRMYLPGSPELVYADPDVLAAKTFPAQQVGAYMPNAGLAVEQQRKVVLPAVYNKYSAPYGN